MEAVYPYALFIHSVLRYVLLLLAAYVIYRAWAGWLDNRPFMPTDNKTGLFLIALVHTQLLLGLALYFFMSPYVRSGLADMKSAMKNDLIRFWTVEHIFGMIVAVVLFQLGRTLSKKADQDIIKHKRAALFYIAALLIVFMMIPWPFFQGLPYFGGFARTGWLTLLF
jgi:hypothetical protein